MKSSFRRVGMVAAASITLTSTMALPAQAVVDGADASSQKEYPSIAKVETTTYSSVPSDDGGSSDNSTPASQGDSTSSGSNSSSRRDDSSSNNGDSSATPASDSRSSGSAGSSNGGRSDSSANVSAKKSHPEKMAGNTTITKGRTCAGTLITSQWVLTAKHCVDEKDSFTTITFGDGSPVDVDSTINHDSWDATLLHLTTEAGASPLPLWDRGTSTKPLHGEVYGFGDLDDAGQPKMSETLTYGEANLNPEKSTDSLFPGMVTQRVTTTDTSTARGDSGGPFVVNGKVYGILSQGVISGEGATENSAKTSLFVPVSEMAGWINDSVGEKVVKKVPAKKGHKGRNASNRHASHPAGKSTARPGDGKTSRAYAVAIGGNHKVERSSGGGSFAHAGDRNSPEAKSFMQKMIGKFERSGKTVSPEVHRAAN